MSKKHVVFALFFCLVALIGIGCTKDNNPFNPEETVSFQNRSGLTGVNCYIDGVLKGTINDGQNLDVVGDYEGDRVLSADCSAGYWPARTVHLDNGTTYIMTLTR